MRPDQTSIALRPKRHTILSQNPAIQTLSDSDTVTLSPCHPATLRPCECDPCFRPFDPAKVAGCHKLFTSFTSFTSLDYPPSAPFNIQCPPRGRSYRSWQEWVDGATMKA